ncbi:formin-like protein [Holotrichia oblita]|uniref:Formin-like protein n=1 Tax=Holotrichia oblita TaxID=644536 RepID=A0ACB9SRM7_HOLOL|nr:formin-like protein [Holotrichia oblita]
MQIYFSFVQEFVADPLDGTSLLLDLLRVIQLSQSSNGGAGGTGTVGKLPLSLQRRALLDELSCLQCLMFCSIRYNETIRKMSTLSAGLFTLSVCIMSNVTKSRIIALQLLMKICQLSEAGHSAVSEALSTLRLRFGEPVRFRFLIGMLISAGGQGELLATGLNFLNAFLDHCGNTQKRLYIQAELFQAGLDIEAIKQNVSLNSPSADKIFKELDRWEKNHIDVENLSTRLETLERENDSLRDKVILLERKIQILQEEKGILISLEQCLKERCSELQDEVISLKSVKIVNSASTNSEKRDRSSPAEDEGISSSERSLTPEEDLQRESSIYEIYSVQSETLPIEKKVAQTKANNKQLTKEEEATIEEVIQELNNIINNAESQVYKEKDEDVKKEQERIRIEEAQVRSKLQLKNTTSFGDDYLADYESEIIPTNLHPQPPRKTRSMVHLYVPSEDYDCPKEIFFENETAFSSEQGSDSLLSASKCLPKFNRNSKLRLEIEHHKSPIKRKNKKALILKLDFGVSQDKTLQRSSSQVCANRLKSKSLDRIDDGLDAMVDIVLTDTDKGPLRTNKSDSGNLTSLTRSASNLLVNTKISKCLSQQNLERNKMFLPNHKFQHSPPDVHYYFPRVQEKRHISTSFLVKRPNAGLYSGQMITNKTKKTEYFASIGSKNSSNKVTDMPSGLY